MMTRYSGRTILPAAFSGFLLARPRWPDAATRVLGRLACMVLVIVWTWVGGVRAAEASCAPTSVHVSVVPMVFPSHVLPVRWWIDPSCPVIETGLMLGRVPAALAPAGQPVYGPGPSYEQDLPVEESGLYWVAACWPSTSRP